MKFLVVSDTHGYIDNVTKLIDGSKWDYVIHLGDVVRDCEDLERLFPSQKFIFVKGNNDFWSRDASFPDERFFEIGGKKFFVCHGHKYHVKNGRELLAAKAREKGADIVLYGHTHQKYLETEPLLIMNPGSHMSYGIIEIIDDNVIAEIVNV